MNTSDYKKAWNALSNEIDLNMTRTDIEAMINTQAENTGNSFTKHLKFDLIVKFVTLVALAVASILYFSTQFFFALFGALIFGIALAIFQYGLIAKTGNEDYSKSTRSLVSGRLVKMRMLIHRHAFITGMTNPLLILSGSYLYFYQKYGQALTQSWEDIMVTAVIMFIGLLINYIAISILQNSQLNDLEISNHVLISEDDSGLKSIAHRRIKRQVLVITLMITGFALFLLLLGNYLVAT